MPTPEDFAFSRLIAYCAYQWPQYRDAAHHRLIARKLEAVERGEIKRLMIFMPPRHGKSMLASEFFPAWYLGRNPNHYVIAATYAQELADDFGRKVKGQIEDASFQAIFPGVKLAEDSQSIKRFHLEGTEIGTAQRGAYYAVGVGGPLTGRGAHLLLIDDPVKNREEADSEIVRKRIKNWYTSTAYTRLMPGARVVIIQCMTGETPVLMEDGIEKPLRDIRKGDRVATYDGGQISVSTVRNWVNNGPDCVYKIRTKSGIIVKANARHPFLVDENGEQKWRRTVSLKKGAKILRVIGGSGEASSVRQTGATCLQGARECARHTTTNTNGQAALDRLLLILGQGVRRICVIAMGLISESTSAFLPRRAAFALCASSPRQRKTPARIGTVSFASIIATIARRFAASFVTTAISQLGTVRRQKSLPPPLSTCEITTDEVVEVVACGVEDVFDVEIERTENFIANGLVSHNTRWHEDDLSGWLLEDHKHEGWEVLSLPALSEDGQALWPDHYSAEALERIKQSIGPRDWSALYQQRPAPESGDYFKREWFRYYDEAPTKLQIYGASDYAITAKGGDYTVHGVFGVDRTGRIYVLDWWRQQATSDVWVDAFLDLVGKHRPIQWAEEQGQIIKSLDPFINKRSVERQTFVAREQFASLTDKASRAQSIRGRMAQGMVYFPREAEWLPELERELLTFPVGVNDDQVDVLSLLGRMLDQLAGVSVDPQKRRVDRYERAWLGDSEDEGSWRTV